MPLFRRHRDPSEQLAQLVAEASPAGQVAINAAGVVFELAVARGATAQLLALRTGAASDFTGDVDASLDWIRTRPTLTPDQLRRLDATVGRMKLLEGELRVMLNRDPELIKKYKDKPDFAYIALAAMLSCLVSGQAGEFARRCKAMEAADLVVLERLEGIQHLSDTERSHLGQAVGYVRQKAMFSAGYKQLLEEP